MRGWLKVHAYTRDPADIFKYSQWYLGPDHVKFDLNQGHKQGRGLVAQLEQVTDRETALSLVGRQISVPVSALPRLPAGEYYWFELRGLSAVTLTGVELGIVEGIQETGANDVLVIAGQPHRLVPYTPQVVRHVDLERGVIELDWDPEFD